MLELIFEIIFDLFGDVILQFLFEIGLELVAESFKKERKANPVPAVIGLFLIGLFLGWLSVCFFPRHLTHTMATRLIFLFAVPSMVGLAMQTYGDFRRKRGLKTTHLATFYGGAALSFSMALVRFFMQ